MKTIHSLEELRAELDTDSGLVLVAFLGNVVDRSREDQLLRELEAKYANRIRFVKVALEAREVWETHRIFGKPVYLFFHHGEVMERLLGGMNPEDVEQLIAMMSDKS